MAVRWYVAYALSYRNIEELMAERGSAVSHATSIVGWSSMLLYSKNLSEFLEKAIGYSEIPDKVTIDKSGANKAGLEAIKRIVNPMMGFKAFLHSAEATLAGIELYHMLKKGQHRQAANLPVFEQFYALAA